MVTAVVGVAAEREGLAEASAVAAAAETTITVNQTRPSTIDNDV